MPSPVSSRETQPYTPADPEEDLSCKGDPPRLASLPADAAADLCAAEPVPREPTPPPRRDVDYLTVSVGAGAIIGADVSMTLDRHGHLYFGLGAGVGLSATVVSATVQGGQLQGPSTNPPGPEALDRFLKGDSVQLSAALVSQAGVANSPGGTAVEVGVGLAQVSGEFQHNWYVLDLPVKW